jgi:hypothetical protein
MSSQTALIAIDTSANVDKTAKMFATMAPPSSFGRIGTKDELDIFNSRERDSKLEKGVVFRDNVSYLS